MYKKDTHSGWKHIDFLLLDIICLHIAFVLAYMVKHGVGNPYLLNHYRSIAIVFTLIDIVVALFFNSFKNVLKRGMYRELVMTVRHVCLVELLVICYMYMNRVSTDYSRTTISFLAIFYILISYIVRNLWKYLLCKKIRISNKRSLLIITTDSMKEEVLNNISENNHELFRVCGAVILDKDRQKETINNIPIVASSDNVAAYICREWVDEVLLALPLGYMDHYELVDQMMEMGMVVHTMIARQDKWEVQKQFVERLGGYTVLTTSVNKVTTAQMFMKRAMDIIGGLIGCILTGIIFLFVAPAIYIQSPGPIFFAQTRVGKNGKRFKMYKFRSMYPDAEERKKELMEQNRIKDGMMFKVEYDPRIIGCHKDENGKIKKGIGNFIRDTSLDEFPQFFNVLKGDMSLVGTRPPTVDEWEKYDFHHRARLAIKPGMTGMWQVSGRSEITDFEEVVKLDKRYIVEWSMGLDMRILFKTIGVVFGRIGSM